MPETLSAESYRNYAVSQSLLANYQPRYRGNQNISLNAETCQKPPEKISLAKTVKATAYFLPAVACAIWGIAEMAYGGLQPSEAINEASNVNWNFIYGMYCGTVVISTALSALVGFLFFKTRR